MATTAVARSRREVLAIGKGRCMSMSAEGGERGSRDTTLEPVSRPRSTAEIDDVRADTGAREFDLNPRVILAGLLFVMSFVFVLALAAQPLHNFDTYFHLRFGQEFLRGHWSLRDPGSVSSFATQSWLPTQWLPEVVMAKTEDWLGLAGVAWLSGLQIVALVFTLYLVARRHAEPVLVAALMLPTLAACSIGLTARPQVLSYLFIAITLGAWLRTQEDGRARWWLIPLTWVWAMCHGMWPVGIGLGVVALLGLALDRAVDRKRWARLALVPLGSAVAAAVTPVGPALYGAVLGVGGRSHFFSEWQSPDYDHVPAAMAVAVCLVIALLLMLRASRRSWTHTLFLLVAGGCAVQSYRTLPIAAIILLPLVAAAGQSLLSSNAARIRRPERIAVLGAGALALVVLAVLVPHTSDQPPVEGAWVDPTLSALPAGTGVLTSWEEGSYLMWAHPQLDLLMHGYGDTFTIDELQRNEDILTLQPGWDSELRATGVTTAVLEPDDQLAYALRHQEGWHVVQRSADLEMLTAPAGWSAG
jgi:hypothetical protein